MRKTGQLLVVALLGSVIASQAALINGIDMTGITYREVDIAGTVNIDITAVGNVDWNLFNSANGLTTPAESKLGGSAFGNYASTIDATNVVSSGSDALMFNWSDGSTVSSSAGTDMDLRIDNFVVASEQQEILSFDLTLAASAEDYVLRWILTDKRVNTQVNVWDDTAGAWANITIDDENDAGDLRTHEITLADVGSDTTLSFQLTGGRTGAAHNLRSLGGLSLEVIPEPATIGMFAAMGGGLLWFRRRFTI